MDSKIFTVRLPDIGEGVVEGEVIEWLKRVGDKIKQDEPVVIVMTDKATVELPAPYPGVLIKQHFQVGEISIKDKPLYDIQLEASAQLTNISLSETEKESPQIENSSEETIKRKENASFQERAVEGQIFCGRKILATPKVRGLAKELHIDLDKVYGTGREGSVSIDDLKRHCSQNRAQVRSATSILRFPDDEKKSLMGIRGLMAKKMMEAHQNIPQFSYFEQVEATHLVQLKKKLAEFALAKGIQLSYMPFFIKALSLCIRRFPFLNSCVDVENSEIYIHQQHNIGIAMASPQGLIVPVLKKVQEMNLEEIIIAYDSLKQKARTGKLTANDMKEATITITNFGVFDGSGTWATPIINYPEVGILGLARIRKEPVVRNQEIVIRDILPVSWSFDHRIIDGEMAVTISHHYSVLIRDPVLLT